MKIKSILLILLYSLISISIFSCSFFNFYTELNSDNSGKTDFSYHIYDSKELNLRFGLSLTYKISIFDTSIPDISEGTTNLTIYDGKPFYPILSSSDYYLYFIELRIRNHNFTSESSFSLYKNAYIYDKTGKTSYMSVPGTKLPFLFTEKTSNKLILKFVSEFLNYSAQINDIEALNQKTDIKFGYFFLFPSDNFFSTQKILYFFNNSSFQQFTI